MNRYSLLSLAAIIACAFTHAYATEGPKRKPGLWETSVQVNGTTMVGQVCVDGSTDAKLGATTDAYMKANCTKYDQRHEGDKLISDSVCTFQGTRVVSHTVTTAIGDTAYHTEGTTTADSKWIGPCKPGQEPGVMMKGPR